MQIHYKKIIFTIYAILCISNGFAQMQNTLTGNRFIKNYSSKIYNAHSQNFDVIQDKYGLMYFANFSGILEYDGEEWRTIETKKGYRAKSLLSEGENIYVGARGEFGILKTDKKGKLFFDSIIEKSADSDKIRKLLIDTIINKRIVPYEINHIHKINNNEILFVSPNAVFSFLNNKLTIKYTIDTSYFNTSFVYKNKLYITLNKYGLYYFDKNKLTKPKFSKNTINPPESVTATIELKDKLLLITAQQGIYYIQDNILYKYKTAIDSLLDREIIITDAIKLNDDSYAFATDGNGILIFDNNWNFKEIIYTRNGLIDNNVNSIYQTKDNIIWAATNKGISLIEYPSPFSLFSEKNDLFGEVFDVIFYKKTLYIGTTNGVFYFGKTKIQKIDLLKYSCNDLEVINNDLIAATNGGLFTIDKQQIKKLNNKFSLSLLKDKKNPTYIYVSEIDELVRYTYKNQALSNKISFNSINEIVFTMIQDSLGKIWISTPNDGIYNYNRKGELQFKIGTEEGLPTMISNTVNYINNKLLIGTENGIFMYSEENRNVRPVLHFNIIFLYPELLEAMPASRILKRAVANNIWIHRLVENTNGDIWANQGDERFLTYYTKGSLGNYEKLINPFLPIKNFNVRTIYPENRFICWIGGNDGVMRFDMNKVHWEHPKISTYIRKVTISANDSVLYYGSSRRYNQNPDSIKLITRTLPYKFNSVDIQFAAPSYNSQGFIQYQYILENFDDTYSVWNHESNKEYTNLPPGEYIFKVKAKSIYGDIANEAVFYITIKTPLFITWWAITIYVIIASVIIYYIIKWRLRKIVEEKDKLETLITERTEEIANQKEELETQSTELAIKNNELEKINLIVKGINDEIDFTNLLQTFLEQIKSINQTIDRASALIYDKKHDAFLFKANIGLENIDVENVKLTLKQAEARYIAQGREIYPDIFLSGITTRKILSNSLDKLVPPKSMLVIVVKVNNKTEGFLILASMNKENAFDEYDLDLAQKLKEHIISAFSKAQILENLQTTLINLRETQDELIRKEKLASVGQLTKGIVDRLINPMNYINNFSTLSKDLAEEVIEIVEEEEGLSDDFVDDIKDVIDMLNKNMTKINDHGVSASRIVKGMEKLLREKSTEFVDTDINELLENQIKRTLSEYKAETENIDIELKFNLSEQLKHAYILPTELSIAINDLTNNSLYSLFEKKKSNQEFKPIIEIQTKIKPDSFSIELKDNAKGIPEKELPHVFEPFFTTKPTSKGTGLGLFMTQDIIKLHKGNIKIESEENEFTKVIINIPLLGKSE